MRSRIGVNSGGYRCAPLRSSLLFVPQIDGKCSRNLPGEEVTFFFLFSFFLSFFLSDSSFLIYLAFFFFFGPSLFDVFLARLASWLFFFLVLVLLASSSSQSCGDGRKLGSDANRAMGEQAQIGDRSQYRLKHLPFSPDADGKRSQDPAGILSLVIQVVDSG